MDRILRKKDLPRWARKLTSYTLYAPSLKGDLWMYDKVDNPEEIRLDFSTTALSPKKMIFPQREVFLKFLRPNEGPPRMEEVIPDPEPGVVFGVRPCDARALALTDLVFGGDFKDLYYWNRRNRMILVGLGCVSPPSPNCFCTSVDGSPLGTEGLDVLLTEMDAVYYVQTLTANGEKLVNAAKALFSRPTEKQKKQVQKIRSEAGKKIERQIQDLKTIPPKLKGMFEAPLWDEESMCCLRCGICTYLCPTCHCFDINDEIDSPAPLKGKRVRTWDTCQFPDFTMHSSGHNPRPDKASRLRQRIMHKFQYFVERHSEYQCTGCGRCITLCPVGIDIIEVLDKVRDHGA